MNKITEEYLQSKGVYRVEAGFPFDFCPLYEPDDKSFSLCQNVVYLCDEIFDNEWILWINDEKGKVRGDIDDIIIHNTDELENELKKYKIWTT